MSKKEKIVEKQNLMIQDMYSFNASYIRVYQFELNQKKEKTLESLKSTLNKDGLKAKEAELDEINKAKLAKKADNLEKKVEKQKQKFANKNTINSRRIWEIDFIRGLVIIGMLIDHFFFDFLGIFTKSNFINLPEFYLNIGQFAQLYWVHPVRVTFRFIGLFFLLFLSGISTHFSKNSLKRSAFVIGAGLIISAAFIVVAVVTSAYDDLVIMGAVACIGVCMLIYSLYKMAFYRFKKVYKWLTLGIALAILISWIFISYDAAIDKSNFLFYYNGYARSIEIVRYKNVTQNLGGILLGTKYFGSDWMGLFPNLGYFFLGGFVGETVYKNRKSLLGKYNEKFNRSTLAVVVPGRYSLWFYLLHQLIYIIIIGGLALIMGAQINF